MEQGVIGDTFYYDRVDTAAHPSAKTADSPEATVLPTQLAEIVYPVFPDKVYELESLFNTPTVVFTGEFIGEFISQRMAIAHRMEWDLSRTSLSM